MKTNRKYAGKYSRKKSLNGADSSVPTTQKIKDSAMKTGKDLLIGVIGGGIAGAVMGKSSLLVGAGVTGYGHFSKKPLLTTFGIGMMAASGFNAGVNSTTQGIDGFSVEQVKARVMSFKDNLSSKLFLDKFLKKKTEGSTNGVGAVQYFQYPNDTKELDFSALENLNNQIAKSGLEHQKKLQALSESSSSYQMNGNNDGEVNLDFTTPTY